jgi:hypothetical protein
MEEVKINDLEPGKDYYIQLVGRYLNQHRKSGKAIGINFQKTVSFREIKGLGLDLTLSPDNFDDDDLFAQFKEVVAVNPGTRECGICHYDYYPSILPSWYNLTDEQRRRTRGGYQFFKKTKTKKEREDEQAHESLDRIMEQSNMYPYSRKPTHRYLGGKTRKTRRKTKTKRRRKTKTKRRRKKTNTKYSKV